MPPTSDPSTCGARQTPHWARRWGKNVQWSMKAWSGKTRQGDLPMLKSIWLIWLCIDGNEADFQFIIRPKQKPPWEAIELADGIILCFVVIPCDTYNQHKGQEGSEGWAGTNSSASMIALLQCYHCALANLVWLGHYRHSGKTLVALKIQGKIRCFIHTAYHQDWFCDHIVQGSDQFT